MYINCIIIDSSLKWPSINHDPYHLLIIGITSNWFPFITLHALLGQSNPAHHIIGFCLFLANQTNAHMSDIPSHTFPAHKCKIFKCHESGSNQFQNVPLRKSTDLSGICLGTPPGHLETTLHSSVDMCLARLTLY